MAHHLERNRLTRKIEMAYTGETPWHTLGQRVSPDADVDEWLEESGMLWTIRRAVIRYFADRAETDERTVQDQVALIRSDTGEKLGIVGTDYEVVQPYEMLEFFRDLVGDVGFKIETAGVLFGGRRVWALAKITDASIGGWDKIGAYALISTTADGSRATEIREVTIRVVCNNTLSMAFGEKPTKHIRITHREHFNHDKVKAQLGLVREHFDTFIEAADKLSHVRITDDKAEEFILKLLRPTKETIDMVNAASPEDSFAALMARPLTATLEVEEEEASVRRPRGADSILQLFMGEGEGATQKGSKGTAWGLLNAVTQFVDHHSTGKTDSHVLDRTLWGSGADLKQEAMTQLVAQFA